MRTTKQQSREEEPTIDDMRYDLAEREAMNMGVGEIIEMLLDGAQGLNEVPAIEIKDEWNQIFGE
ncbi:MAG: hypothetical protein EBY39_08285 [Flavobacteriia bacterium]|nr:hypothetical protein [Flavobacteriia bacterium]